jgi:hypothetical protein
MAKKLKVGDVVMVTPMKGAIEGSTSGELPEDYVGIVGCVRLHDFHSTYPCVLDVGFRDGHQGRIGFARDELEPLGVNVGD